MAAIEDNTDKETVEEKEESSLVLSSKRKPQENSPSDLAEKAIDDTEQNVLIPPAIDAQANKRFRYQQGNPKTKVRNARRRRARERKREALGLQVHAGAAEEGPQDVDDGSDEAN